MIEHRRTWVIYEGYYPTPVVRNDVLEENPEIEDILHSVTET